MAAVSEYINIGLVSLFVLVLCLEYTISTSDLGNLETSEDWIDETVPSADKRYARMSYGRYGYGRSRGRSRYNDYYGKRYRYRNYYQYYNRRPWQKLPNRKCYRQKCRSSKDCCRRHSICDKVAKICYDCWYGYPCRSHNDCCERFPYCSRKRGGCTGRYD